MGRSRSGAARALTAIAWGFAAGVPVPVGALDFEFGNVAVNLKTELSAGTRIRMQDRNADIVGKTNLDPQLCEADGCSGVEGNARFLAAPGSLYLDNDDGNLNYDQGDVVAATSRLSVKFGATWQDYGVFARGIVWYDPVNQDFEQTHPNTTYQPARTERPKSVENDIGWRQQAMEAYVYGDFPFFNEETLTVRVGNQIMYWGESNFLVLNSLNAINPPDANRVQFPGSNLDEYFTPQPMVQLLTAIGEIKIQTFYEYGWKKAELEPAGSYFSTDDTVGAGGRFSHLGAQTGEDPDNLARPEAPLSQSGRTFYRRTDREPKGGGQYGLSLKYFAQDLGQGTEFGLYFANYHSRIPTGSFFAAQASACRSVPGLPVIDDAACLAQILAGNEAAPIDTITYFLEYPENVQMFGATAVTTIGEWAFQAEYAYRPNLPVQVDTVDLTYAALQPAFPQTDLIAGQLPGARHAVPDYVETRYRGRDVQPGRYIPGYERLEVGQLNLSTLLITPDNPFGASQLLLLVETGLTHALDFPSLDQIQFEGPGTNAHHSPGIDGTGAGGQTDASRANETYQRGGFATQYAWGYRIAAELEYPDLLFGLTVKPAIAIAHDVDGTAVGNAGNFIEGRKQFDTVLTLKGESLWSAALQYSWYTGAGEYNLLRDRDCLTLSATLNF